MKRGSTQNIIEIGGAKFQPIITDAIPGIIFSGVHALAEDGEFWLARASILRADTSPAEKVTALQGLGHDAADAFQMAASGRLIPQTCVDLRDAL